MRIIKEPKPYELEATCSGCKAVIVGNPSDFKTVAGAGTLRWTCPKCRSTNYVRSKDIPPDFYYQV